MEERTRSAESHPIRGIVLVVSAVIAFVIANPVVSAVLGLAGEDFPVLNREAMSHLFYAATVVLAASGAYQIYRRAINEALNDLLVSRYLDEPTEQKTALRFLAALLALFTMGSIVMALKSGIVGVVWWSTLAGVCAFLFAFALGTMHLIEIERLTNPPEQQASSSPLPPAIQYVSSNAARVADIRAQLLKYADTAPSREQFDADRVVRDEWMAGAIGLVRNVPVKDGKHLLFYESLTDDSYGAFLEAVGSLRAAALSYDESYLP